MKIFHIILLLGLLMFGSCGPSKKEQEQAAAAEAAAAKASAEREANIERVLNENYSTSSSTSSQQNTSSSNAPAGCTPPPEVMDDEEDAYEEARALREEDRLNGTRTHEGDDYNGYDDDYDDGYYDE